MIDAQGQVPEGAPSSGGSGSPPRSDRVTSPAARVALAHPLDPSCWTSSHSPGGRRSAR
jgi:hypothetical protein